MRDEPLLRAQGLRFGRVAQLDMETVEYLLNDLSRQGLRVWQIEHEQWGWSWGEQAGQADGLGSAVADAVYWYFGLSPDPGKAEGDTGFG